MNDAQAFDSIDESAIAIIGMSGRFPGAKTIDEFWQNIRNGVEGIYRFSDEELQKAGLNQRWLNDPNYVKASGILSDIDAFDASFFDMSPKEAELTDPQHRLFLECAWEALENAGYNPETYNGLIGVYAGSGANTYLINNLKTSIDALNPATSYQIGIANSGDYLTTRVSYKLNLKGPSLHIQTACSTSLVTVHVACQSLLNGECDMALAGGVSIRVPHNIGYLYQEGTILSPDGHCRAFDAKAKGTVGGNGVGIVVLKRLEDALADRDSIQAIVKGSAINNDGSLKIGYTAPSVEGQTKVIREARGIARVDAETITYIETHGTGTVLGDPIEIAALTEAFRSSTQKTGFCALGSVKTNIGHLDAAAGVTSLIKTVLALKHQVIPPSLNFTEPNPQIDFANSPFYINTKLSEWKTNGTPRRAGVSSFGIGGTNAHAILEEWEPLAEKPAADVGQPKASELILLSAKTATALETATTNLATYLNEHREPNLADIAHTLSMGRKAFNHRRMLVSSDIADAAKALKTLEPERVFTNGGETQTRPAVFMFSGQGSQYVNMSRELYESEPTFRERVDCCCQLLEPHLKLDLREILYPAEDAIPQATRQLERTAITQPALFVIEYALATLWMSWGIRPVAAIGHSIGEYVAATIAGTFSLEDALAIVAARGNLMQSVGRGSMLAVPVSELELQPLLGASLEIAAVNGPSNCVVSGPAEAVEDLQNQLVDRGLECRRLHTSGAFHSQMMEPILEPFSKQVRQVRLNPPQIPYISNVTGTWITAAQATDPDYYARHLRQTVRFAEGVQQLFSNPEQILLEVGPGRVLSTLAKRHPEKPAEQVVLTSLRHPQEKQSDVTFLLNALGRLWLTGAAVNWSEFYGSRQCGLRKRLPLPTYPFERQRYWIDPQKQADPAEPFPQIWRSLVAAGRVQSQRDISQFDNPSYLENLELVEQLSVAYTSNALQKLGAFSEGDRQYSVQQVRDRCQILPRYQQLLSRCLNSLAKRGYLQQEGEDFRGFKPVTTADFNALSIRAQNQKGDRAGFLHVLQACGENYADILTGRADPLELLFSAENQAALVQYYQDSPESRYFIEIIKAALQNLVQSLPPSVKLNILEVGAGTGSTTASLLPILPPEQTRYTFTDVGSLFLQQARQKFDSYSFIEYRVLDLDRHPREQGFETHSFDVIVASQVLHATKNLSKTLQSVRSLLAPEGVLMIWEMTQPESAAFNIIFSMMQPLEADEFRSPLYPFLSKNRWREALQRNEFVEVESFPETDALKNHILIAKLSAKATYPLAAFSRSTVQKDPVNKDNNGSSSPSHSRSQPRKNYGAPRNQMEGAIATIWQDVLGVKQVGIHDNFFDLGGDSLIATQLIVRVRQSFSVDLPVASLIEEPTVASLAKLIEKAQLETRPKNIVSSPQLPPELITLQPHGTKTPLFWVHPIAGVIFPYYELARLMGKERPVYGLQSVGIDGKQQPLTEMERMAGQYIKAIQQVRPRGPYLLAGWSFGAILAFEIAVQLQQQKQQVSEVLLLDTPAMATGTVSSLRQIFQIFPVVAREIWPYVFDYFKSPNATGEGQQIPSEKNRHREAIASSLSTVKTKLQGALALPKVFWANSKASIDYKPSLYAGKIRLFCTEESLRTFKNSQDRSWGWQSLTTGDVEVYQIPGNHMTLVKQPHVQVLAKQLEICLNEHQENIN